MGTVSNVIPEAVYQKQIFIIFPVDYIILDYVNLMNVVFEQIVGYKVLWKVVMLDYDNILAERTMQITIFMPDVVVRVLLDIIMESMVQITIDGLNLMEIILKIMIIVYHIVEIEDVNDPPYYKVDFQYKMNRKMSTRSRKKK